jgi:hypothetical protein
MANTAHSPGACSHVPLSPNEGLPGLPAAPAQASSNLPGWPSDPLPGPQFPGPRPCQPNQDLTSVFRGIAQSPAASPLEKFFKRHNKETSMSTALPANIQALLSKPVEYFKEHGDNGDTSQPALTNVAFALDGSTSMRQGKEATVEGYNAQVAVVREGAKSAGKTTYTDIRFNTRVELRSVAGSLELMQPLTMESYSTVGGTALYDAIGATISALLNTEGIDNPNTATLVTVVTDGEELDSQVYDSETLRALIERLEATGRWTFALVGPLQSVTGLASILSVKRENIAGFDVNSDVDKRKAFTKVAAASASYMSLRSTGATHSVAGLYNDEDLKGR